MTHLLRTEIAMNFEFFEGVVGDLMDEHAGRFALLRSRSLVRIFDRPRDALEEGYARFGDGVFSVQRVIDRSLDLGFLSYGEGDRAAD